MNVSTLESMNAAGIIQARAEYRIGQVSRELKKAPPINKGTLMPDVSISGKLCVLEDAGIDHRLASNCEDMTYIPEEEFEEELERTVKAGKKTTSAALQKKGRNRSSAHRKPQEESTMSEIAQLPREVKLLQQAASWLAECQDLDEIKGLKDKAEAIGSTIPNKPTELPLNAPQESSFFVRVAAWEK